MIPRLICLKRLVCPDSAFLSATLVLIQVSSHYGSRRQEAQRLGRILRAKSAAGGDNSAYFYSLVSKDTLEMYYSSKRQQFLVDQGYEFKVITELQGTHARTPVAKIPGLEQMRDLVYPSLTSQLELLNTVLMASVGREVEEELDEEEAMAEEDGSSDEDGDAGVFVSRSGGLSIAGFSGADSMAYMEIDRTSAFGRQVALRADAIAAVPGRRRKRRRFDN